MQCNAQESFTSVPCVHRSQPLPVLLESTNSILLYFSVCYAIQCAPTEMTLLASRTMLLNDSVSSTVLLQSRLKYIKYSLLSVGVTCCNADHHLVMYDTATPLGEFPHTYLQYPGRMIDGERSSLSSFLAACKDRRVRSSKLVTGENNTTLFLLQRDTREQRSNQPPMHCRSTRVLLSQKRRKSPAAFPHFRFQVSGAYSPLLSTKATHVIDKLKSTRACARILCASMAQGIMSKCLKDR